MRDSHITSQPSIHLRKDGDTPKLACHSGQLYRAEGLSFLPTEERHNQNNVQADAASKLL